MILKKAKSRASTEARDLFLLSRVQTQGTLTALINQNIIKNTLK